MDELPISIIINFLLLLVTGLTVRYASQTLHMEYSSQVIVSNYSRGFSAKRYYQHQWKAVIKNVGNGYVVKAFILLTVKKSKFNPFKLYYLSKPIVELYPNQERILLLQLGDEEMDKGDFGTAKMQVIYQDSLGNVYKVNPRREGWNKHLETFDILPKRMSRYGIKHWVYLLKLKVSSMQGNTNPERLRKEIDKKQKKYEPIIKAVENIQTKDTE